MTTPLPSHPHHAGPDAGGHPDAVRVDLTITVDRDIIEAAFRALVFKSKRLRISLLNREEDPASNEELAYFDRASDALMAILWPRASA